jgi:chromatin segregation and condensation protein Rec8/ScpA/Scc1 (kleisin family)
MATLELVKMKRINVYQQDNFGPLWLYRYDCDESVLPLAHATTPHFAELPEEAVIDG